MNKIKQFQITLTDKENVLKEQRDIFKQELIAGYNASLKAMLIWLKSAGYLTPESTTDEILQTYLYSKEFF